MKKEGTLHASKFTDDKIAGHMMKAYRNLI